MRLAILHRVGLSLSDGGRWHPNGKAVDMHIFKLRKKIKKDPTNPKYIMSVYGGGYKIPC